MSVAGGVVKIADAGTYTILSSRGISIESGFGFLVSGDVKKILNFMTLCIHKNFAKVTTTV